MHGVCAFEAEVDVLTGENVIRSLDAIFDIGERYKYYFASHQKITFYCINISYPMDNCFTCQRDRSRQMPEKDVLYILLAGLVTESAFARWHIVLPFCLDIVTS